MASICVTCVVMSKYYKCILVMMCKKDKCLMLTKLPASCQIGGITIYLNIISIANIEHYLYIYIYIYSHISIM